MFPARLYRGKGFLSFFADFLLGIYMFTPISSYLLHINTISVNPLVSEISVHADIMLLPK